MCGTAVFVVFRACCRQLLCALFSLIFLARTDLPFSPGHVKEFKGRTLAVDGFAWLHRGAFSCALELATGQATARHIDYCVHMVSMLRHYGVTPVVVLDGAPLPGKADVNSQRSAKRREMLTKGQELMDEGRRVDAEQCFQKAISITADMANKLHRALLAMGVDCLVAPFEADAQMAYLVKAGLADGVITEDSDMVPYGVDTVVYKMNKFGECSILDESSLLGVLEDKKKDNFKMPSAMERRLHMCILAGCDYLPSVPGVGIATASKLVARWNTGPRAIRELRRQKKAVPDDYEKLFRQAELTFLHHWVYDPKTRRILHLNPVPDDITDLTDEREYDKLEDFLGTPVKADVAERVCALGELHPVSLQKFPEPQAPPRSSRGESLTPRYRLPPILYWFIPLA